MASEDHEVHLFHSVILYSDDCPSSSCCQRIITHSYIIFCCMTPEVGICQGIGDGLTFSQESLQFRRLSFAMGCETQIWR